ncbi:MAG: tail fiber protein, partial [Gilliamella sp.]|uniref:phage tail protein n=1 Tax=Gilliamella sp. TaxID=1891236 RepID=UPI0025E15AE8
TQSGIVKLNSSTDSTSETEAATPLAVKKANDNAISANNKANIANANAISANSNANNAHKNIEVLGGRISAVEDKFTSGGIESRVYSHDKRFYFLVRNDGLVGLFDSSENRLLWAFRDNYLEEGVIPVNRVVNLNEHIMSMFGQSFGHSGYAKLPNGLIIQWGVAQYQSATGGKGTVQSFFTAFPTTCFLMMCSDGGE